LRHTAPCSFSTPNREKLKCRSTLMTLSVSVRARWTTRLRCLPVAARTWLKSSRTTQASDRMWKFRGLPWFLPHRNVNEITELLNGNPWSEELTETIPSDPYTTEEISALFPGAKYALHIDGMSHGYRSFGAACDALVIAQRGEFGFAAIDHAGMRKVTRKAA
jgi:hypothetical protein